jgi:hypothetical protein
MEITFEEQYFELTDEDVLIIAKELPYIALTNTYINGRLNSILYK